jgi:N-acetylneuraminic acid mutarotase
MGINTLSQVAWLRPHARSATRKALRAVLASIGIAAVIPAAVALATPRLASGQKWTSLPSIPTALASFGFGALKHGGLLVAGGIGTAGSTNTFETYSASTNSWDADGKIPEAEDEVSSATGTNGDLYMIGGDLLQIYSPKTATWTIGPRLPNTISAGASVVALPDSRILMIGGNRAGGKLPGEIDAFSPTTGKWAKLAPMPLPTASICTDMAAAVSPAGVVYIEGGSCAGARGISNQLIIFNPNNNKWTLGPSMSGTPICNAAGAYGANGSFYVIGGEGKGSAVTAQVMAYNPKTNKWIHESSLPVPYMRGEAVALPSGEILYAGGMGTTDAYSSAVWQLNTK